MVFQPRNLKCLALANRSQTRLQECLEIYLHRRNRVWDIELLQNRGVKAVVFVSLGGGRAAS